MLYKSIILFITLLIAFTEAKSFKAYDAGSFKGKRTNNNRFDVKTFYINGKSCWFTSLRDDPCCCINFGSSKLTAEHSWLVRGEEWHHCVTVKKGKTFIDVSIFAAEDGLFDTYTECSIQAHLLKQDITNAKARCDSNGCLTQYGYVRNRYIYSKRNC